MQVVAHNLLSQFTDRQLNITKKDKEKSTEKLASGYRINRSADDAAGLEISENMRWQIRGLKKCDQNIQDGISLLQTADGGMDEIASMLHRMRELTVQGLNDTNTKEDVQAIQAEIDALVDEIDSIAEKTTFNTLPLLQGDMEHVTEQTITTTTESKVVKMRIYDNSILPEWVKVNDVPVDPTNGITAGKMIQSNPYIDANTKQVEKAVKYEPDPANPGQYIAKSNWTENMADNYAAVIDFSGLANINGTTDYPADIDMNGDGTVDGSDVIPVSNVWLELNKLVNSGFSTKCCTCSEAYGVLFTTKDAESEIDHSSYNASDTVRIYIDDLLEKAADDPQSGKDIAEALVQKILDQRGNKMDHFTRYEKDAAVPGKLVVYDFRDNEPDIAGSAVYADFPLVKTKEVTIPAQTLNFTYLEVDDGLMIQTGAKKDDAIAIHLDNTTAGANGLNLRGNVDIISNVYNYSTSITTRTEPYSYVMTKTEQYLISPARPAVSGYDIHGEPFSFAAKPAVWGSRVVDQKTVTGTRTIYEQTKTLIGVSEQKNPQVLDNIDRALDKLNGIRTTLGAYHNRLEHTKLVDNNTEENTQAAESRIRDTDMAKEMVDYAKHSILEQAGQSMLAQANQLPQGILSLLQ